MLTQFLILIFTAIISILLGYVFTPKGDSRIAMRNSLLGGLIGTTVITLIFVQFELIQISKINEKLVNHNPLSRLDEMLKESPQDVPMKQSIEEKKKKIEEEILNIINGSIYLKDEEEVIAEWERCFNQSSQKVYATNYIPPHFWLKDSKFSKLQKEVQEKAGLRGVEIYRIFIYNDQNKEEVEQTRLLAQQQKSIKINVRFLSYNDLIKSTNFVKYSSDLKGAIDFVLFDVNIVLLTYPNPSNRDVESGILTKERQAVDAAKNLFENLYSIANNKI